MSSPKFFKYKSGELPLPVFFPDATRGVLKTLDSTDIKNTKTKGVLVNTYHLWRELDKNLLLKFGGIKKFMNYDGAVISDSGGFQVMSVVKKGVTPGKIKDEGVIFHPGKNKKLVFSPEISIKIQMSLGVDMVVVLDDFTDPKSDYKEARDSVERTINWAKRSKIEFEKNCKIRGLTKENRPYILGVVQGGYFQDLRKYCTQELVKIGFDGLGYGGWPMDAHNSFDYESAKTIADNSPEDYFLYGLGIGKPEDIVGCTKLGFNIFDCVLPTRDGRHGRLYVFNETSIDKINVYEKDLYHYVDAKSAKNLLDSSKICECCDCLLCTNYTKSYLSYLFKIGDVTAMRLSSIHNLRFYNILMQKLQEK